MSNTFVGNITILGDLGVGKTQILNRVDLKAFTRDYISTIGADLRIVNRNLNFNTYVMRLWEFTGDKNYMCHVKSNHKDRVKDVSVIVVYDVTNRESFESVQLWIKIAQDRTKNGNNSIVLVGNKCDLQEKRQISTEDGKKYSDELNIKFIETSALSNSNVDELFNHILQICLDLMPYLIPKSESEIEQIKVAKDNNNISSKGFFGSCIIL